MLLSIYEKEKAEYFDRCMQSIWNDQTIKPNEIVLVIDGHINNDLYLIIEKWKKNLGELFKIVSLKENMGLGIALNEGLKECSFDLIARMDTDDISLSNRFEKQLNVFKSKDIDVCSGFISEFIDSEENIISYRKLPENHDEIVVYSKTRNPLNHVTTMMKKTAICKVNGYKDMLWMEDYYLWIEMIRNNAKLYNLQETLVKVRVGNNMLSRRRGFEYIKAELRFLKRLKEMNYLSNSEFIKNILIKVPLRMMPRIVLKFIYKVLRSKY